jgi:hypothetical protein
MASFGQVRLRAAVGVDGRITLFAAHEDWLYAIVAEFVTIEGVPQS